MTSDVHSPHPDIHDAGLADGCPACDEIAQNPIRHLDDVALRDLAAMAVLPDRLQRGRSTNERIASAYVLSALEELGRLCEVAPEDVATYLRERWRLVAQIENPLRSELDAIHERLATGQELTPAAEPWKPDDPVWPPPSARGIARPSPTRRVNE